MGSAMNESFTACWEFPPFWLDKANAILRKGNELVPLRPKNFAALCYLVERSGELVTKDELLDAVWEKRCVSEGVLKVCINELRQALGDTARTNASRYLVTVARRGYRFIAPVRKIARPSRASLRDSLVFLNGSSSSPPGSPVGVAMSTSMSPRGQGTPAHAAIHARDSHSTPPCRVDRPAVKTRLLHSWKRSLRGQRQVVFLTGEAGIGKTTLIEMFLAEIAEQAPAVLRMRCVEHFGRGETLLPLIEAIEKRCRAPEGAGLIELLRRYAPVWLAQLPSVLPPEERASLQHEIFGASPERMVREGCELLERLSAHGPLVLVLEDLHWSDPGTLDLISLLARRDEPAALLVLASYRPVDAQLQAHPVMLAHRELSVREISSEIALGPFSADEVSRYLVHRFPGMEIRTPVSHALFARTGGHPLFVSNLVEYLVSRRQWPPLSSEPVVDTALPDTIRLVIEREIERLNASERRLLGAGSVIGARFSTILLASALEMQASEAERHCDDLVRRGQILVADGMEQVHGEVVAQYAFRHALYIDALYQQLAATQRVKLHLRIGDCLERIYGEDDLGRAAELALHFEQGWDWQRAIRYLSRAAANASHRFANRQAHDYLARALAMVERLPTECKANTRLDLLKQSSAVRRSMGDVAGAKTDLEDMLATALSSGSAHAEVVALLELSRIQVWLDRGKCLQLVEQALNRSRHVDDPVLQSVVKGMWGGLHLSFDSWREDCVSACQEAMAVARASRNPLVLHSRLTQHIYIEMLASRYRSACATAEEALTLSRSLGDGYTFMIGHYYHGLALLHLGEWGKLRRAAEESGRAFEHNCNDANLPLRLHQQIMIAWLHVEAGDFEGARTFCEDALSECSGTWATFIRVHFSAIHGRALLGLGDYRSALRSFDIFFQGEKNETLPVARNYAFPACQGACETWLALGELRKARDYAQRLHGLSVKAPERTYLGLSHRLLAEIALKENMPEEAEAHLSRALDVVKDRETPLAAWRIYATAEKLYHLRDAAEHSHEYHLKTRETLEGMFSSLPDSDPLHSSLPTIAESTPLSARMGEAPRIASNPASPAGAHVRLVNLR